MCIHKFIESSHMTARRSLKYDTPRGSFLLCFPLVFSFNRSLTPADFHVRLFADREGKQPWRVSPVIARTQIGFIHGQPPYIVVCLLCTEFKRHYLCTYTLSKFLSHDIESLPCGREKY